jgi:hypothetical protein
MRDPSATAARGITIAPDGACKLAAKLSADAADTRGSTGLAPTGAAKVAKVQGSAPAVLEDE